MESSRLNLARRYRPFHLSELVGQSHVMKSLEKTLEQDRIAPAYLFSGPRGTGKTTTARIFARAACCTEKPRPCDNCQSCQALAQGKSMAVIEIDGASHTGVDDVRSIIEAIAYKPSVGRRNVYIIDEVHMLSTAAFNALLKTLEEPPQHALFLFATTEPEKLPSTILSRVQRFELKRLLDKQIVENLRHIATEEKIDIDDATLDQIAAASDGSLRDGQTLLEQMLLLSGKKGISEEIVDAFLGTIGSEQELTLLEALAVKDTDHLLKKLELFFDKGKDFKKLLGRLLGWLRSLLILRSTDKWDVLEKDFEKPHLERLQASFESWSLEDLDRLFEILWQGHERMRRSDIPRVTLETTILRACRIPQTVDLKRIIDWMEQNPNDHHQTLEHQNFSKPQEYQQRKPKSATPMPSKTTTESEQPPSDLDELLQRLKRQKPSLHGLLTCRSNARWQDDQLEISFPSGHFAYKQLQEKSQFEELQKTFSTIAQKPLQLQLRESQASQEKAPTKQKGEFMKEAKRQILEDPNVQKATKAVDGKVTTVNIEGVKTH